MDYVVMNNSNIQTVIETNKYYEGRLKRVKMNYIMSCINKTKFTQYLFIELTDNTYL